MPEARLPSKADIERLRRAVEGENGTGGLSSAIEALAARFDDVETAVRNSRILFALVGMLFAGFLGAVWFTYAQGEPDEAPPGCEISR